MLAPIYPLDLNPVLTAAWRGGFSVKSDFARTHAESVAAAACLGLITTGHLPDQTKFGRDWHITTNGLRQLSKPVSQR